MRGIVRFRGLDKVFPNWEGAGGAGGIPESGSLGRAEHDKSIGRSSHPVAKNATRVGHPAWTEWSRSNPNGPHGTEKNLESCRQLASAKTPPRRSLNGAPSRVVSRVRLGHPPDRLLISSLLAVC
jgi:hypothetical protein